METNDLTLSVISPRSFEPSFQLAKRAVEEGNLGQLLLIEAQTPFYRTQAYYDSADWRGTIAEDGGALMNQGIHQIDLLLWFGGAVRSVYGTIATQTHRMEAEDMGAAIVTFENGAMGPSWHQPASTPSRNVFVRMAQMTLWVFHTSTINGKLRLFWRPCPAKGTRL